MTGIYAITNPSGKKYIGQSWNISARFFDYMKLKSCKSQKALYNSFLKYGVNNHKFEIIHELPKDITQEILDTYEILYICQYKQVIELLNIRDGGSRGKHSEQTKQKMKEKVFTDEHRKNISESKRGKRSIDEKILRLINKEFGGRKFKKIIRNVEFH